MLLIPLFHHCNSDKYSNDKKTFEEFFSWIKSRYPVVLPGEEVPLHRTSVTLTFDDGYYDFYHCIYPLLKRHDLRALLAVSPAYILERCDLDPSIRLGYSHDECYRQYRSGTFCTWEELREMADSGHVQIASHGYRHIPLDEKCDLEEELKRSRDEIGQHLGIFPDSFVYPFGKSSPLIDARAKKYYPYRFRIGNAANFSWNQGLYYRINADDLSKPEKIFNFSASAFYIWKYLLNLMRQR